MISRILATSLLGIICFAENQNIAVAASTGTAEIEQQEYKKEFIHTRSLQNSINKGEPIDLKEYEKRADEVVNKWRAKKKEYYANLILEVCKPLASGVFNDERQYVLARKYALSALDTPDAIPLKTELDLVRIVVSNIYGPNAPTGQKWAQIRKQEITLKFHAWKRLANAIDPNWNPNERLFLHPEPPKGVSNFDSGAAPESIVDPVLRAQYEEAIIKNNQKNERHSQQRKYREWLKEYSEYIERSSVRVYSKQPYNSEELRQLLKEYITDKTLSDKILVGVDKYIENQEQKEKQRRASGLKKMEEIDKTKYEYIGTVPGPKTK